MIKKHHKVLAGLCLICNIQLRKVEYPKTPKPAMQKLNLTKAKHHCKLAEPTLLTPKAGITTPKQGNCTRQHCPSICRAASTSPALIPLCSSLPHSSGHVSLVEMISVFCLYYLPFPLHRSSSSMRIGTSPVFASLCMHRTHTAKCTIQTYQMTTTIQVIYFI